MMLDGNELLLGGAMSAQDLTEMSEIIHDMLQTEGEPSLAYEGFHGADCLGDEWGELPPEAVRLYLMRCMAMGTRAVIRSSAGMWEYGTWQIDALTATAAHIGLSGRMTLGVSLDQSGNTLLPHRYVFGPDAPAEAKLMMCFPIGQHGEPMISMRDGIVLRDLPALAATLTKLNTYVPPCLKPIGRLEHELLDCRLSLLDEIDGIRAKRDAEAAERDARLAALRAEREAEKLAA